jgi:TP901 family phage tail tape measure protein
MASNLKIKVQADTASAKSSISNLQSQLASVKSGGIAAGTSGAAGFIGMAAGITGAVVVAKKLAQGIGECISTSNELNKSMANVATLIPKSTERVYELKDGVMDLSVETGKSFDDLSQGTYQVISAFGDSADTMDYLTISANGAAAGMSTTEEMLNLISATMKGYGDVSVEAAKHTSDLAFQTVKLGQTSIPALSSAIMKVTDNSSKLGISQEELYTTFATLTGVTGEAAEVSTQFKSAQVALLSPTDSMSKAMKAMGYESGKAMIEQNGLSGTMKLINDYAIKANIPLQDLTGSTEAMTFVSAIGSKQNGVYNDKLGEMENASGSTNEALTEVKDGVNSLGFEVDQNKAKWEKLKVKIGDDFNPVAKLTVGWLGDILTNLNGGETATLNMKTATEKITSASEDYNTILEKLNGKLTDQERLELSLAKIRKENEITQTFKTFTKGYKDNQSEKVDIGTNITTFGEQKEFYSKQLKDWAKDLNIEFEPDIDMDSLWNKISEVDTSNHGKSAFEGFVVANTNYINSSKDLKKIIDEEKLTIGDLSSSVADGSLNIDSLQFSEKGLYDIIMKNVKVLKEQKKAASKVDLNNPEGHAPSTGTKTTDSGAKSSSSPSGTPDEEIKNNDTAIAQYQKQLELLLAKDDLAKNEVNRSYELSKYTAEETDARAAVNALYDGQATKIQEALDAEKEEVTTVSTVKSFLEDNNDLLSEGTKITEEKEAIDAKILVAQSLLSTATGEQRDAIREIIDSLKEEKDALDGVTESANPTWADDVMKVLDPNDSAGKFKDKWEETFGSLADTFGDYASDIMSGINAITDAQLTADQLSLDSISSVWNDRKEELQDGVDDAEEAADDEVDAWKDQYDAGAISYEEYLAKKTESEAEYKALKDALDEEAKAKEAEILAEQNRIDKKRFESDKKNALATLWINTASAIVKGYSQLGFWGGSAFALGMGTVAGFQSAAINDQQYVPALAEGGIATSPTMALIGEGGEPEMVLPLSKAKNFGFGESGSAGGNIIINMNGSTYSSADEVYAAMYKGISKAQKVGRIKQW